MAVTTTVVVREILAAVTADVDATNHILHLASIGIDTGGASAPPVLLYIIIFSYFPS